MNEVKRDQWTEDAADVAPPGRVLLVDDQQELRRLFERALVRAGHEVVAVDNGRKAIELAGTVAWNLKR